MLAVKRWLARMRYKKRLKRLQKGFVTNDACRLRRADKCLAFEDTNTSLKKTTDVCTYPFVLSQMQSQSFRRYVLYNDCYCIFPSSNAPETPNVEQDQVLRTYGAWLSNAKTEHAIPTEVLEAIKRENKVFVHRDVTTVFNHFFVANKFVYGGYVLSLGDDDGETTLTLVYYRTQPVPKDGGIVIDPNIFFFIESIRDMTTFFQINNQWCGTITKEVSMAQSGVDTNISCVPLDKTLYGTVTCALKTTFYTQPDHVNIM